MRRGMASMFSVAASTKSRAGFAISSSASFPRLPEVHQAELTGVENEDVRRMGIRMKEAVMEDHGHPGVSHPIGDVCDARRPHVPGDRAQIFLPRRNSSVRTRSVESCRITAGTTTPGVRGEVAVEGICVPGLVAVIELEPDRPGELVDQLLGVDELESANALLQELRRLVEEPEVGLDLPRGFRALDLDRDLLTVREHRSVHLADRRRGERLLVELDECPFQGQTELGFDGSAGLLERKRSDLVLQPAELDHDVGRDDVGSGRQQLAELDKGGAELVEHLPQSTPALGGGDVRLTPVVPGRRSPSRFLRRK